MRKLIVLSLDAMFDADLAWGDTAPFWQDFLKNSAGCTQVKTVFPSLTYPAHVTLMTGCRPMTTGIGQNQPFQPCRAPENRVWYWEEDDVRVPTLFHAVKAAGGDSAAILWPVTGKSRVIRWNFPEVLALPGENQVMKMLRYGTPGWILKMEMKHGKKRKSTGQPDLSDYAMILLQDLLRTRRPTLSCVHLVDLDEMRHQHGVMSPEAMAANARNAARVEAVWKQMQETPGYEDAILCVVSDHGQADITRTVRLQHELHKRGLYGVQVQSCGMSAYLFASEEKAQAAANLIQAEGEALGVAHVYDRQELDALGCAQGPVMAVEACPETVFADALDERKREKATHGFGPGHAAENCLLLARGKGINAGTYLPPIPMEDVAPTLAGLMGIALPTAEGKDHSKELLK